ncbi:MAG: hypothetical protein U1E65_31920 [Myxococcota bacterium]
MRSSISCALLFVIGCGGSPPPLALPDAKSVIVALDERAGLRWMALDLADDQPLELRASDRSAEIYAFAFDHTLSELGLASGALMPIAGVVNGPSLGLTHALHRLRLRGSWTSVELADLPQPIAEARFPVESSSACSFATAHLEFPERGPIARFEPVKDTLFGWSFVDACSVVARPGPLITLAKGEGFPGLDHPFAHAGTTTNAWALLSDGTIHAASASMRKIQAAVTATVTPYAAGQLYSGLLDLGSEGFLFHSRGTLRQVGLSTSSLVLATGPGPVQVIASAPGTAVATGFGPELLRVAHGVSRERLPWVEAPGVVRGYARDVDGVEWAAGNEAASVHLSARVFRRGPGEAEWTLFASDGLLTDEYVDAIHLVGKRPLLVIKQADLVGDRRVTLYEVVDATARGHTCFDLSGRSMAFAASEGRVWVVSRGAASTTEAETLAMTLLAPE